MSFVTHRTAFRLSVRNAPLPEAMSRSGGEGKCRTEDRRPRSEFTNEINAPFSGLGPNLGRSNTHACGTPESRGNLLNSGPLLPHPLTHVGTVLGRSFCCAFPLLLSSQRQARIKAGIGR
jgi:hypothetical protein